MKVTKDQIRKLQTLKHQVAFLCKDRATWEQFLSSCAGRPVTSSTELSMAEGGKVIDALRQFAGEAHPGAVGQRSHGATPPRSGFEGGDDKSQQLKKIEHLLDGRGWAYADALAKRICKVDSLRFVRGGDLRKIIAALQYDARRKRARVLSAEC